MKVQYGNSYYVGDPIHVLSELDMLAVRGRLNQDREGTMLIQGRLCWFCRIDKDMEYVDQNMNSFELPSGVIALIHTDAIDDPEGEDHGVMIKPEVDDLTCERELAADTIIIGNLVISRV